ncbi:MAG: hypothetical protein RIF37_02785 [Rhodospirillaceae bacterium]
MPLTDIQRDVVVVLKQFRTPHTYVAGGAVLNHNWLRLSDDLDIFHDGRDALPGDIADELKALAENGFACEMIHSDNWTVEIIARKYGFETKIQWFSDLETSQRFFAAQADEQFGFRLRRRRNPSGSDGWAKSLSRRHTRYSQARAQGCRKVLRRSRTCYV